MTYLIITAIIFSLICLVLVTRLILKDTKEYTPPSLPAEPYVFKHIEELKSKTVGIPGTEGGHQRVDIEENVDLTGLSPRAKKAIIATEAFKVSDIDMGTLGYYLKNTKGVGPKTIAEINAWSEANYGKKIID